MPGGLFALTHAVILGLLLAGLVFSYFASKAERRPGPVHAFGLLVAFTMATIPFAIVYNDARTLETFEFAFSAHSLLSRGAFIAWIFYLHALTDFRMRWAPRAMYGFELVRAVLLATHLETPYFLELKGIERVSQPFGGEVTISIAEPSSLHFIQLVGSGVHVLYAVATLLTLSRIGRERIKATLALPFLLMMGLIFVDNLGDALGLRSIYLAELAFPLVVFALTASLMEWLLAGQRAREEIVKKEAEIAQVLDSIADGVVICDNKWRIVRTNPVAGDLAGLPKSDDLVERFGFADPVTRAPPEPHTLLLGPRELLAGSGTSARLVRVTAGEVPHRRSGIVGYVIVMHDITERERRERLGRRDEKMRALGELAGGVAHDFNNYMAAIGASARLLERRGDDPRARALVTSRITEAVDSASTLTRGLLDFSRDGTSAMTEDEIFSVNDVAESAAGLIRSMAGTRVDVVVELGASEDRVRGSASELQSALLNLGKNAIDAIEATGTVRISTRRGTLSDGRPAVSIEISDTGAGIAPEHVERIFEPFFTTKPIGEGTGFGLPSAHRIVAELGGTIEVESVIGEGTTFLLALPRVAEIQRSPPAPGRDERIRGGTSPVGPL